MDLEVARKTLSKRGAISPKRVAFFVVAGLALVGGILLRSGQYFGQQEVEQNAPVTVAAPPPSPTTTMPAAETTESVAKTPPPAQEPAAKPSEQPEPTGAEQAGQTAAAVPGAEQPELPAAGMTLVSRQPVQVRAGPSSSAPTTFGFPAGRPFRVIGHEGGFVQIQDVKSGATGWIDEAALAPPPRMPIVSAPPRGTALSAPAPSRPKPVAVGRKPATPSTDPKQKATKKDSQVNANSEPATEPDPVQTDKRPGLLGGIFKGIFGNGN